MTILKLLPYTSRIGDPFADYLNVTVPIDFGEEAAGKLLPIIESLGPHNAEDGGVYRLYDSRLKPTSAVFKFKRRGKVLVISSSGMALAALRSLGAYSAFLAELASFPHRVSMLHATLDYLMPDPAGTLLEVKEAAFAESLSLTRKRILKGHVTALLSSNAAGKETGTVYLGNRANADVWAKVYDKQHERVSRGFADPGPLVRVEVAVQSDVGATLRDAHNPSDLFFHFAGKSLVESPPGFAGWSPGGEGYSLPKSEEVLPLQRLDRLVDYSHDLTRIVEIAVSCYGDKAGDVLARLVRRRCDSLLAVI